MSKFDHIMGFAHELAKANPQALTDLVRLLLRPLQDELMLSAIENEMHGAREPIASHEFFWQSTHEQTQMMFDGRQLAAGDFVVSLKHDPVLPCPWHRGRYIDCLSEIGTGKQLGRWREHPDNHSVTVWLPWGIAFVNGGNHSIATGIIGDGGSVYPKEVFDQVGLLNFARCDGRHYRRQDNNQIVCAVKDYRTAAVFEIGRLMQKAGVVPMRLDEVGRLMKHARALIPMRQQ
jgi:hypothetical protein